MNKIIYKIGEISQIFSGGDRPKICSDVRTAECSIPIFSNGLDEDGLYGYTNKAQIEGDCITVSARGANIGVVFYRDEPFLPIVRLLSVVPNRKKIDSKYLYYYFKTDKIIGTGFAQPQITIPFFQKKKIFVYENLATQQKIAHILSRYDEAIENNNKRIKLLEQMVQNLYKEWFVRFRFPGYENCEFENGIPVGWEIKRAQEIFDITIGRTPDRKQFEYFTNNEQDILWVSISDMKDNIFISKSFEYLTNEAVKKVNMPMVKADTVLLSFKLSVGRVSITTKLCCTNEAIAHCNTNDKDLLEYSYLYLKLFNYQNLGNTSAIGTAINSTIIKNMKVVVPNRKLIEMFHNSTKDIFAIIKKLNYSNENLAKQRDLLLPRLMSGKLEV